MKRIWQLDGDNLRFTPKMREFKELENKVYVVGFDLIGYYVTEIEESFDLSYKIYGLESNFIDRTIKSYEALKNGNLGILLNGLKGTGKTVTSKLICNRLNQPVIIIDSEIGGVSSYLNSIPQNITIFIDEYEKIFKKSSNLLTIMDGVLNSSFKRLFILTTNDLYIEPNLIERPSRIRYLKEFTNLKPIIVEEIIDDILENKSLKGDCVQFISSLETITIDIVKAVINEVNLHNESPNNFADVFNVRKVTGMYDMFTVSDGGEITPFATRVDVYPRPNFEENNIGCGFHIDNKYIGVIDEILNINSVSISIETNTQTIKLNVKIEPSRMVNDSFKYDEYGMGISKKSSKVKSLLLENIIKELDREDEEEEINPPSPTPPKDELREIIKLQSEEVFFNTNLFDKDQNKE